MTTPDRIDAQNVGVPDEHARSGVSNERLDVLEKVLGAPHIGRRYGKTIAADLLQVVREVRLLRSLAAVALERERREIGGAEHPGPSEHVGHWPYE